MNVYSLDFREAVLMYVDELSFSKRGSYIWTQIARQSIVAARRGNEILAPFGYTGTCDAQLFNFWLKNMLIPKLKPGQIVIMDNASIHKTDTTRKLIEEVGCRHDLHAAILFGFEPDRTFLGGAKEKTAIYRASIRNTPRRNDRHFFIGERL